MSSRHLNGILLAVLLIVASCPAAGAAPADPAATEWHEKDATLEPGPGTDGSGLAVARAQQQHDRDRASQTTQAAGCPFAVLAALAAGGAGIAAGRRPRRKVRKR